MQCKMEYCLCICIYILNLFQPKNLTLAFGKADVNANALFDSHNIWHDCTFCRQLPTLFVCFHQYGNAEKEIFPIKCFVTTIALYLQFFHLCSFTLLEVFYLNFFCQKLFHSIRCVLHAKRTNFQDLVFTWNQGSKLNSLLHVAPVVNKQLFKHLVSHLVVLDFFSHKVDQGQ